MVHRPIRVHYDLLLRICSHSPLIVSVKCDKMKKFSSYSIAVVPIRKPIVKNVVSSTVIFNIGKQTFIVQVRSKSL